MHLENLNLGTDAFIASILALFNTKLIEMYMQ